jgi:hypothetical protein
MRFGVCFERVLVADVTVVVVVELARVRDGELAASDRDGEAVARVRDGESTLARARDGDAAERVRDGEAAATRGRFCDRSISSRARSCSRLR